MDYRNEIKDYIRIETEVLSKLEVEAINDALDQAAANGELSEISMKYFGIDVTSEE